MNPRRQIGVPACACTRGVEGTPTCGHPDVCNSTCRGPKIPHVRDPKGFTLVEVIMASFILVLGIGIIGGITSGIVRKNFYSQRHTQAVILAQNKIEELLNDGYESPTLNKGETNNPLNPVNATGDSSGVFYQSWTVQDASPIIRSKQITSKVQWRDKEGNLESVTLTAVCIDQSN